MHRPFRRRVFYIPGYDPMPPRRYRELYRREGAAQAAISGHDLTIAARPDRAGFGWVVAAQIEGRPVHTEFEVLVWHDIVRDSMGHGIAATYGQLLRTAWLYVATGALWRMMRLRRGPVIAALYPIAVLILQLIVAVLTGMLVARIIAPLVGGGAALALAAVTIWGILTLWRRIDGRFFAYYLMQDDAFTAKDGGAYPPALTARIDAFATRIRAALTEDWDEVLVIGHSSGAYIAVSALAEMPLPASAQPELSLMTLGHVVPMAAFLPHADRLRNDLRRLSGEIRPFWLDVTAPSDACCFALCDPVAVSGAAPPDQRGPLVISAAFSQTLSPARLRTLKWRWFRRHFQYLCAFDRPGGYDYFAITAGPRSLRDRFGARRHSPGRIATPVMR